MHCLNFILAMIAGSFPCGSLMAVSVRCVVWWILIEFSLYITQDFTTNHAYMISIVQNFTFLSEKLSKLPLGQVTQIQTELWPDLSAPEGPRWTYFSQVLDCESFDRQWAETWVCDIPHICCRHHRRCLCENFLSGVNFSRLSEKMHIFDFSETFLVFLVPLVVFWV